MPAATDALDRSFGTDDPALRPARDPGGARWDQVPGSKRLFVQRAMGTARE